MRIRLEFVEKSPQHNMQQSNILETSEDIVRQVFSYLHYVHLYKCCSRVCHLWHNNCAMFVSVVDCCNDLCDDIPVETWINKKAASSMKSCVVSYFAPHLTSFTSQSFLRMKQRDYGILFDAAPQLRTLSLVATVSLAESAVLSLVAEKLPNLTELSLSKFPAVDIFGTLLDKRSVCRLSLTSLTICDMQNLICPTASWTNEENNLRSLTIARASVRFLFTLNKQLFSFISFLNNLTELTIQDLGDDMHFGDKFILQGVPRKILQQLTSLDLDRSKARYSSNWTDCTNLRYLSLSNLYELDMSQLCPSWISKCLELTHLDLSGTLVMTEDLDALIPLINLRVLKLRFCEGMQRVSFPSNLKLPELLELDVSQQYGSINHFRGYECYSLFPKLQILSLMYCMVEYQHAESLQYFTCLEQLYMSGSVKVTVSTLNALSKLKNLKILELSFDKSVLSKDVDLHQLFPNLDPDCAAILLNQLRKREKRRRESGDTNDKRGTKRRK